jgi:hypothetical protein
VNLTVLAPSRAAIRPAKRESGRHPGGRVGIFRPGEMYPPLDPAQTMLAISRTAATNVNRMETMNWAKLAG